MKKILIISNSGEGLLSFRKELIINLSLLYSVSICIPDIESESRLDEIAEKVIICNFNRRSQNPFQEVILLSRYIKIVKKEKPDIVLTYTIKPNVYGGIVCQLLNVPYIANVTGLGTSIENGGPMSRVSLALYRNGLKNAVCVFFQNEANHRLFVDKKIVQGRTRIIPGSGVNLSAHPFTDYPDDEYPVQFLFIGRIMKDKGIEELLYVIGKMHDEGIPVKLDIVGIYDGEYENIIREAEKGGFIKYHGFQLDVNPFIQKAHCVVLPSYHEGMSNVMLEAASSGRPVITTNIPGCRETFDEGITGFGCEPRNTDSLMKAMKRFLKKTNKERAEMGKCGRLKVEKEFNRSIVIDAYLEEIKKAM